MRPRRSGSQRILFIVKNLYTMERMGVMYLSSYARRLGWSSDLLVSDGLSYRAILSHIHETRPEILAFSVMSPEYEAIRILASRLRADTRCFMLFGGPHPTFCQDLIREPFVDGLLFGEGDLSFPAFLEKFTKGEDYTRTEGMHFRVDGRLVFNGPARLVEDLDAVPFPDRELMAKGDPLHRGYTSHFFFASRGCPHNCSYCFNHKYNAIFRGLGRVLRRRSVDNLLKEIAFTKSRYGTTYVYVDDDIFTLTSEQWLEEFAERFPREVGLPFFCNVHVKSVNETKVKLLKKAGCRVVCFGVETGDESVSRQLLRRDISNQEIIELSGLLHKYRIKFATQNMLALPVRSPLEVDLRTLDLNLKCRPTFAISQLFFPLPGTDLAAYAVDNGYLSLGFESAGDGIPDRTNTYSALTFRDPAEKKKVQRLQKLFGLLVSFPFLKTLLPLLMALPLDKLYALLYATWLGFTLRFRLEGSLKSPRQVLFYLRSLYRSSIFQSR